MQSYRPVEATLRGLDVLQAIGRLGSGRTKDIQEATGLSGGTVVRMLETLVHAGYVYQVEPRGPYALTAKVVALAAGHRAASELAHRAAAPLALLQRQVGWPSDVAIREGDAMITIATSPAAGRLSFNQPAGFRASLLGTSLGLAYIAHAPEAERVAAIAQDPPRLTRKFAAIRRYGYATIDRGVARTEHQDMLQTIGVPLVAGDRAVGSMNLIFLRQAVPLRTAVRQFLPPLREAARAIMRDG